MDSASSSSLLAIRIYFRSSHLAETGASEISIYGYSLQYTLYTIHPTVHTVLADLMCLLAPNLSIVWQLLPSCRNGLLKGIQWLKIKICVKIIH